MFSTLHRFFPPFFNRDNQKRRRDTNSQVDDSPRSRKHEPDSSSSWQTLSKNGTDEQIKTDGSVVVRRSQRLLSGAISQLTSKNRLEFVVEADISRGYEKNRIPAISYKQNDKAPSDYHYVAEYVQYDNVHLDGTLKVMHSCQCQGDCSDGRCTCSSSHQTGRCYDSKGRLNSTYNIDSPHVLYECNAGCNCNRKLCKNMVIQRGSQAKFVLFRTRSRGWGVRSLEVLKRGTFVGVYSGELISVGESRQRDDDTYLFNLANSQVVYSQPASNATDRASSKSKTDCCEDQPEIVATQEQGPALVDEDQASESQQQRELEAQEASQPVEDGFVCDAKFYGNFTRFINHSCEPNVIGIRSFTKSQDSRFPYIAFFTNKEISANTELTLNYGDNYWLVKCKRDKVYCLCRRPCCRFNRKTFPRTLKQYNEGKQQ